MPRFNEILNSMLGGEVSPKADGRTELPQYKAACKTLENFITQIEGGIDRRPGTQFITQTDFNDKVRLIPFIFSKTESYVIAIGTTGKNVINVSSRVMSAISGTPPGYSITELDELQFAQSGDVIFITHPNYSPKVIQRTALNTFSISDYIFATPPSNHLTDTMPFRDPNISSITLTPSATSGTGITITASAALFTSQMVGCIFKITHGVTTGAFKITAYTNSTHVTADVIETLGGTTGSTNWTEGSWSNYRGWPRTVCFYQGRLVFGGNASQPDTIWASQTNSYYTMSLWVHPSIAASDPISFTLASQEVNAIQWLSSGKTLAIGTSGAEYIGSDLDATSTPDFRAESTYGSRQVQAKRNGYTLVYVDRTGRRLQEMVFDFTSQSYVSTNLSKYARHMTKRISGTPFPIKQIEVQPSDSTIWCVVDDGALIAVTRDKDSQVAAWHYHPLGGKFTDAISMIDYPPVVESISIVPSPDGTHDDVYLQVKRTVNTNIMRTIEMIGAPYDRATIDDPFAIDSSAPFFLDASIYQESVSPTKDFSGFDHLVGETLGVLADGKVYPDVVVDIDGNISLAYNASKCIAGLKYRSRYQSMRLEAGSQIGSAQGSPKFLDRTVLRLYQTSTCAIGPNFDTLESLIFRNADDVSGAPLELFSGDYPTNFTNDNSSDGFICIEAVDPLPCSIQAVIARGDTHEQ